MVEIRRLHADYALVSQHRLRERLDRKAHEIRNGHTRRTRTLDQRMINRAQCPSLDLALGVDERRQ